MRAKVHIGSLIKQQVLQRKLTIDEFASRINCHRTNVYHIYKQETIDVKQLQKISSVLDYNFFEHYKEDYSLSAHGKAIYKYIELSKDEVEMLSKNVPIILEIVIAKESTG